jgi:hypothetical protein
MRCLCLIILSQLVSSSQKPVSKVACYEQADIVLCNDVCFQLCYTVNMLTCQQLDVAVESPCNALRQPLWKLREDCTYQPRNGRGEGLTICGQHFLENDLKSLKGLNVIIRSAKRGSCEGQVPWQKIAGKINSQGTW